SAFDHIRIWDVLQLLSYMVNLFQVAGVSAFRMLFALAGIAPLKADFGMFIFGLHFVWEIEKVLDNRIELILKRLSQSVVFDGRKTNVVIRLSESLNKGRFLLRIA